jgi:AraC family transcriptional regulator
MSGSYESAVLGDRFRLNRPPTLLTRTASIAPIGFTRLRSEMVGHDRTKDVPAEDAFAFHVLLQPVSADIWIDGRRTALRTVKRAGLVKLDRALSGFSA